MTPKTRPRTSRPIGSRRPRARGVERWMVALWLVAALAGFAHGVSVVGSRLAEPQGLRVVRNDPSATFERDPLRGSFWAPAGSLAHRPATPLRERAWRPAEPRVQLADLRRVGR